MHLRHLGAWLELHGVERHDRSGLDRHHLAGDVVRGQRLLELLGLLADELLHLLGVVRLRILEQVQGRELVALERLLARDVLVAGHLLLVR